MKSRRIALATALFGLVALAATAATYTVTTTADSGAGSLRQAILDANANAGADTIAFDIPGSGDPHDHAADDAADDHPEPDDRRLHAARGPPPTRTRSGSPGTPSSSSRSTARTSGASTAPASSSARGPRSSAGSRSTAAESTTDGAIYLQAVGSQVIAGNVIGLDPTGHFAPGAAICRSRSASGAIRAATVLIGGTNPADRNLISGNLGGSGGIYVHRRRHGHHPGQLHRDGRHRIPRAPEWIRRQLRVRLGRRRRLGGRRGQPDQRQWRRHRASSLHCLDDPGQPHRHRR